MKDKLLARLLEQVVILYHTAKRDELLSGNVFIDFSDRKIEIIDPIIHIKGTTKQVKQLIKNLKKNARKINTKSNKSIKRIG